MANVENWEVGSLDEDGNLAVDGTATATGGFIGGLTGSVVSDNVSAGLLQLDDTIYVADGAIDPLLSFTSLDATSASCAMTLTKPVRGKLHVIDCVDASNACTVTLGSGTFDGTNSVATFDAAGETLVLFGITPARYVIVENIGGVTFS